METGQRPFFNPRCTVSILIIAVIISWCRTALGEPARVPVEPYLNGVFPDSGPDSTSDWRFENAFTARITFDEPMGFVPILGTPSLYVLEKKGKVWLMEDGFNEDTKKVALNITNRTQSHAGLGLRSLALHPEFGQPDSNNRGFIYLIYTTSVGQGPHPKPFDGRWRLSRFTVADPDAGFSLDPESELILIEQYRGNIHHGGDMFFGPQDGFLYFSNGDSYDSSNTQQIDRNLYGGIFRIDVDMDPTRSHPIPKQPIYGSTNHYFIPNDNPFVGESGALEEFFALGLRNPYRISIDPDTGAIYCGDVGAAGAEEINRIIPGGNYQWPYREGFSKGTNPPPILIIGIEQEPIKALRRTESTAIIGGGVYRGSKYEQDLGGSYLYADYSTGVISSLKNPGDNDFSVTHLAKAPPVPANNPKGGHLIVDFSLDQDGEIYVSQQDSNGKIFRLTKNTEEKPEFPQLLSQTGVFTDTANLLPSPVMIPYEVNSPLWSDGALKKRWVIMPNDGPPYNEVSEQAGWADKYEWSFPTGTVFVKHFELPVDEEDPTIIRRLETRFLIIDNASGAYGLTYRWREDQSDAELVDFNGLEEEISLRTSDGVRNQMWSYPSATQCMQCHTAQSRHVLGVNSRQLNRTFLYGGSQTEENQLIAWSSAGLIKTIGAHNLDTIPSLSKLTDDASIENRIRSYLDANCSHCHQPGGVRALYDARFDTPLVAQGLINGRTFEPSPNILLNPENPTGSYLYQRFSSLGVGQMPPLGKNLIHDVAVQQLKDYIRELNFSSMLPSHWTQTNIGSSFNNGLARFKDGIFEIGSAGYLKDTKDNILFIHRVLEGDFDFRGRINSPRLTGEYLLVYSGLMARENLSPGSPAYFLGDTGDGGNRKSITLVKRLSQDAQRIKTTLRAGRHPFQRLTRNGRTLRGYYSNDGVTWTLGDESTDFAIQDALDVGMYFAGSTDIYGKLNSISLEQISIIPSSVDVNASNEIAVEGGETNGEIIISRSGPLDDSLTVKLNWSGAAASGSDISDLPEEVTFGPGIENISIPIVALSDTEADAAEKLTLEIVAQSRFTSSQSSASVGIGEDIFNAWRSLFFDENQLLDSKISGALSDWDGDQMVTLQEFFHGTEPTSSNYKTIKYWNEDDSVYLKYPRNILATNIAATVQKGTDLRRESWTEADLERVSSETIGNQEWITLRMPRAVTDMTNLFLRLKIELQ